MKPWTFDPKQPGWVATPDNKLNFCRYAGARRGDAHLGERMPMRFSLLAVVVPALFVCNTAIAQVNGPLDGVDTAMPTIGATSPLGLLPILWPRS